MDEERLEKFSGLWKEMWPAALIHKAPNVKDGIDLAMGFGTGSDILVTGSLYLVEAALKLLRD